jgi:hypothetical protein
MDYEKLKENIVAFAAIVGDQRGENAFRESVYGAGGVAWLFVSQMPNTKYGKGIDLFLMRFSIEGEHKWFPMPKGYSLGRYSQKEHAISFSVPIDETRLKLMCGDTAERNRLFVEIFNAFKDAVNARKFASEIDFKKELFLEDLSKVIAKLET